MTEGKRCLIYTRRVPPQFDSLERQNEYLRRYAEQQGYTVVGETTDMVSVQTEAHRHSFDVLVTASLSQVGRDMKRVYSVLKDLNASGQTIHSAKEGLISPIDYTALAAAAEAELQLAADAEASEDEASKELSPEQENQSLSDLIV